MSSPSALMDRASILEAVLSAPGWSVVLEVLDAQVEATRTALLECQSPDPNVIHKYQLCARLAADIRRNLVHELKEIVAAGKRDASPKEQHGFLAGID